MRAIVLSGLATLAVAVLAAGASPAAAHAEAPWWGVTATSVPTRLNNGLAQDEVQELTVSATGGQFVLVEPAKFAIKFFSWNATAGQLQAGLEELYGPGNVTVTGGPGDEEGTAPYRIAFTGALAVRRVEPLVASLSSGFLSCAAATGPNCKQSAFVTEATKGRPDGRLVVTVQNRGDAGASGTTTPIRIHDTLPAGVRAAGAEGIAGVGSKGDQHTAVPCQVISSSSVSCETNATTVAPYEAIQVQIPVVVTEPSVASSGGSTVTVSGGGAAHPKTVARPLAVGGETTFGYDDYELLPEEPDGALDTQAGSHPFQLTTVIGMNTIPDPDPRLAEGLPLPPRLPREVEVHWPAGLVGNPTPLPQCSDSDFGKQGPPPELLENLCPAETAIGVAVVTLADVEAPGNVLTQDVPLFNLTPRAGEPSRLGFMVEGVPTFLDTAVRTGSDYGVTIVSHNVPQLIGFLGLKITVWGVPGDHRHDGQRGWDCLEGRASVCSVGQGAAPPFLVMPTSCGQPFTSTVQGDSWPSIGPNAEEIAPVTAGPLAYTLPGGLDGCNRLPFAPELSVAPDGSAGSTPSGLTVGVHVPQQGSLDPNSLVQASVKDTTVALPEGVAVNPGGADGLEACSESQIGFLENEAGEPARGLFTPTVGTPFCPDASKIGTVDIETPLLPNPLKGAVYLAAQNANPFGSLLAMYIVAEDPVSGSLVKLPGQVSLDQATGRLTAQFTDTPQVPFEDLHLHFFGGSRAPLGTPAYCGVYTTSATFVPWSGNEPANASSTFDIASGPYGRACQNPLPFHPSLTASSSSVQAGGFSPFTTTISRSDGDQDLQSLRLTLSPGLLGEISQVPLCQEPQADAGTCGPESLIGHTIVSVGLGSSPYTVAGGQVFLTAGYGGAPYGLSIVNPAKAGPFDLGKVVVRARVEVDRHTAQLTVTTDASGPHAIPRILDGIPLQIQHVYVAIDRPDFTFNPTDCNPLSISGLLSSDQGAQASVSERFQVTNCVALAFKPSFRVAVTGATSRINGAGLTVKLAYPKGALGHDANIARVKVELPKQLPSRLTTLQKACLAATFEANPDSCPAASVVGHAKVVTPVLPVPLEGPAIFVSHGGEAFPDLTVVLKGYGVTVDLVGTTFISKSGVTSTTFKATPDVPFETFQLTLPQGRYSALAVNTSLCAGKTTIARRRVTLRRNGQTLHVVRKLVKHAPLALVMPTEFIAQNGVEIHQNTPIAISGCTKATKSKNTARRRGKTHR